DAVVMRFSVVRESLVDSRVGLEARGLEARLDHPQPAVGKNRSLERLVGLKTHDDFVVAIDVAGFVGKQCRGRFSIYCKHSLFSLLGEVRLQLRPDRFGALRRPGEKSFVACVGRHVTDDEIANVDGAEPIARPKTVPAMSGISFLPQGCACLHGASPTGLDWLLRCPRC